MLLGFKPAICSPGVKDPFENYWIIMTDPSTSKPRWYTPKTELIGKLYQMYQTAYRVNLPINLLDDFFKIYFSEACKHENILKENSEF